MNESASLAILKSLRSLNYNDQSHGLSVFIIEGYKQMIRPEYLTVINSTIMITV